MQCYEIILEFTSPYKSQNTCSPVRSQVDDQYPLESLYIIEHAELLTINEIKYKTKYQARAIEIKNVDPPQMCTFNNFIELMSN